MCGIIGIHFKNPRDTGVQHAKLEKFVNELLLGIEHRGKDATGLLTVDAKNVPTLVKADIEAEKFIAWRQPIPKRVRTILGHTRFATQGAPTNLDNDHPVQYGTCFAIHNGHISNDKELFEKFSLGRHAEVDSEIIPALFDKFGLDKAHLALQELGGNMATAVVDPERFPGVTVLAKGWSSPVEVWETKHGVVWASTKEAIQKAAEKAFGFKPAANKISSLVLGDILYMDGDNIEMLSFEPKKSTSYKRNWSTSKYGTGYSNYSSRETKTTVGFTTETKCKSCGCKRLWHGSGGDFSGRCNNKIELSIGGFFLCRCEAFVADTTTAAQGIEYCDGCGRMAELGELKEVGNEFFCINSCARGLFPEGPTSEQLRKAAEQVIAAQVIVADEMCDGDEFANAAWDAREEAMHAEALKLASKACGLTPSFIDWVVFKAPIQVFEHDNSNYLSTSRNLAEGAYKDAEKELRNEVIDMDIARWESGDMRNTREAEEHMGEVCGVVVSIEEWERRESEVGL